MKGKIVNLKIVLTLLVVLTAGFCFALGTTVKQESIKDVKAALTKITIGVDEYSALFDGNVVFSAEKVLVNSAETNGIPNDITSGEYRTFLATYDTTRDDETYTFLNLANGDKNKTVIDNGEFVKLDNKEDLAITNSYYIENNTAVQEAIMISFGAYIYNGINVGTTFATKEDYAGITYLNVTATRNGNALTIPDIRNIRPTAGGLYFDFTYLITQQEDNSNEGYYTFKFDYLVNNKAESGEFSFYLVNNTSYTKVLNEEYGYQAKPILGWLESVTGNFEKTLSSSDEGYVRYMIGQNGEKDEIISYPTLTYDYTKYELSYTHTANQRNTQYRYETIYDKTANGQDAKLVCTMTSSSGTTTKYYNLNDYKQGQTNLVTIMLTEPGTYVASYKYLYNGETSTPLKDLGFETQDIYLSVHGFNAYYSKAEYEGAKMQYFNIATKPGNHVDLVVPGGYNIETNDNDNSTANGDISSMKDQKLGFVYKLVESENREGDILTDNSTNSLVNESLKNAGMVGSDNYYDYLIQDNNRNKLRDVESIKDLNLDAVLASVNYAQTNQGSLWIEGNDVYTNDSFYVYSSTKIKQSDFVKLSDDKGNSDPSDDEYETTTQNFTNTTSFKAKGYYLVFINVKPSGISQTNKSYWQIFAFQYTSNSVDISVEALNDDGTSEIVAGGKYTNKEVAIYWKKPGIFDRTIKPFYYSVTNQNYNKDQMLTTTKNSLSYIEEVVGDETYLKANLGSGVTKGNFVRYLIRLESEGDSATYKLFTIDKQDISGIRPYLIQEMYSGTDVYYAFANDINGYNIPIDNAITDGYATLTWNPKSSGASIKAEFSYTPFSISNSVVPEMKIIDANETWITTNYVLGTTVSGADLYMSNSFYDVDTSCILFNQGIYVIDLQDDAGNKSKYAFIIDRTKNYFMIDGENPPISNSSYTSGTDVEYTAGDYKSLELKLNTTQSSTDPIQSGDVANLIRKAAEGKLNEVDNYYVGANNNVSALSKLFSVNNSKYYLKVKNSQIVAYKGTIKDSNISNNLSGKITYVESGATSYVRTLYVVGESQKYSILSYGENYYRNKNNSYVTIEINKDNARGSVYYSSDSNVDISNEDKKLKTGSDRYAVDGTQTFNGLNDDTGATSAKHLAFAWNIGSGNFEVVSVTYEYYTLKPNNIPHESRYFYSGQNPTGSGFLYNYGFISGLSEDMGNGKGRAIINGENGTNPGLYIITRTYATTGADLGYDTLELNYYFIVDRSGIIETGVGSSIRIELMERESEYNKFSILTQDVPSFSNSDDPTDKIINQKYNVYLTTSKVPATFNIPTGKYYYHDEVSGEVYSSNGYEAGRLNVSVYFNDINGKLNGKYKNGTIKIYGSTGTEQIKDDVFNINIYNYLLNSNYSSLVGTLTKSDTTGTWFFLPGDYIIRITDNVIDTFGKTHEKYIGLRIVSLDGPQIDIYSGSSQTNMFKVDTEKSLSQSYDYEATVSQEYLKVVLPVYDYDETRFVQVDPSYIKVTQIHENGEISYLNHPYVADGTISLKQETKNLISFKDGVSDNSNMNNEIYVWLDTKLRVDINNPNSAINYENLGKLLQYKITVRYKLNNKDLKELGNRFDPIFEKYKECYSDYETTYLITIDRSAPSENINNLNSNDILVGDYNKSFGKDQMFENKVYQTISNIYFTKQYSEYYDTGDSSYIYIYQVKQDTKFILKDVNMVYAREIDFNNFRLNLPLTDTSEYPIQITAMSLDSDGDGLGVYGGLDLTPNGYYEIVEVDAAGNATQYVIHYEPGVENIELETKAITTRSEEVDLTIPSANIDNNFFVISEANAVLTHDNVLFFKVELEKLGSGVILKELTNAITNFNDIAKNIVKKINDYGFGTYNIKITSRQNEPTTTQIRFYDSNNIETLETKHLIFNKETDKIYIDPNSSLPSIKLSGANVNKNGMYFYAEKITIKTNDGETTFVGIVENGGSSASYYEETNYKNHQSSGEELIKREYIPISNGTTYYLTLETIFPDKSSSPFRFNTDREAFIIVEFDDPFGDNDKEYYSSVDGINHYYYGYTDAKLKLDKAIYSHEVKIKDASGGYVNAVVNQDYNLVEENGYNVLTFKRPDNNKVDYRVILKADGVTEAEYYFVIDTKLSDVIIRDSDGAQKDIIEFYDNMNYDDPSVLPGGTESGRMILSWSKIETDYFDFVYELYELNQSNNYDEIPLNNVPSWSIVTGSQSRGIYKFVISVFSKDGDFIGNRIGAFEVASGTQNTVYEVRSGLSKVESNSQFKIARDGSGPYKIEGSIAVDTSYNTFLDGIGTNIDLPLYVTNKELNVASLRSDIEVEEKEILRTSEYEFSIYKISKQDAYSIFIGILKVNEKHELVNDVQVVSSSKTTTVSSTTSFTTYSEKSVPIVIESQIGNSADALLSKNTLKLRVFYNGTEVDFSDFNGKYSVVGSGQYSFIFEDLAGNIHEYRDDEDGYKIETLDTLNIYALREVVVTLNGQVPIPNAYYNDRVSLALVSTSNYVIGSINVEAKLNGSTYIPSGYNPYIFKDFGTYRVVITAAYYDGTETRQLSKTVVFTILNVKEARKSIDLTGLSGCKLTQVLNQSGDDVTEKFKNVLSLSMLRGGYNVSHDDIMAYAEDLGIMSGKQTFTLTYNLTDGIYPERELTFKFTLNNETPTIQCSLDKGESTTKGFKINFNPMIIYEQIGESYIFINDRLVAHINEDSVNNEQIIETTFKAFGEGDYYVKLVSSSGVILDSYKVTIKEPLNAWAIIVIIVIVAVVATVTITIIVLRRKMRIR